MNKTTMNQFERIISSSELILTEGALAERLTKECQLKADQHINHAGMIYEASAVIENIYRQYVDIAEKSNLPIMLMTPTRRVNAYSLAHSKFSGKDVISDSSQFLNQLKSSYGSFSNQILVGGLLGCKGDAYSGEQLMGMDEAYAFHRQQTLQFKRQPIDYLFAGIMPEINEAIGLARAMAETGLPYVISFMLRNNGRLLDGTLLADAIQAIDEQVSPKPVFYMTNCIHPSNLIMALNVPENQNSPFLKRFMGIQANTSALSPEELNGCSVTHQDDFDSMIDDMIALRNNFNLTVFGGCCGTNDAFIEKLTNSLKETKMRFDYL